MVLLLTRMKLQQYLPNLTPLRFSDLLQHHLAGAGRLVDITRHEDYCS